MFLDRGSYWAAWRLMILRWVWESERRLTSTLLADIIESIWKECQCSLSIHCRSQTIVTSSLFRGFLDQHADSDKSLKNLGMQGRIGSYFFHFLAVDFSFWSRDCTRLRTIWSILINRHVQLIRRHELRGLMSSLFENSYILPWFLWTSAVADGKTPSDSTVHHNSDDIRYLGYRGIFISTAELQRSFKKAFFKA